MAWYTIKISQPVPAGVATIKIKVHDNTNNTTYDSLIAANSNSYTIYVIYDHQYTVTVIYITATGVESQGSSITFTTTDITPPLEPGNMTFSQLGMCDDDVRVKVLCGLPIVVQPEPDEFVSARTVTVGNNVVTVPYDESSILFELAVGTYSFTLQDKDEAGNESPVHVQSFTVTRTRPPCPTDLSTYAVTQSGATINYQVVLPPTPSTVPSQYLEIYSYTGDQMFLISAGTYSPNAMGPQVPCELNKLYTIALYYVDAGGHKSTGYYFSWVAKDTVPPKVPNAVTAKVVGADIPGWARVQFNWEPPRDPDVVRQGFSVDGVYQDTNLATNVNGITISLQCTHVYNITLNWFDSAGNSSASGTTITVNCSIIPQAPPPIIIFPGPIVPLPGILQPINPDDYSTWPQAPMMPLPPMPKPGGLINPAVMPTDPYTPH